MFSSKKAVSEPASSDQLRSEILEYLRTHNTLTIACCEGDCPWAAAVFYASDGFDLYFFSNPASRHGVHISANQHVSATIHEDYSQWKDIRGIQLEGRASKVRSPKLKIRGWEVYRNKFPFVDEFFSEGPFRKIVEAKLSGICLYRIVPQAIWYLDNSKGFGHREMLSLSRDRTRSQA